MSVRLFSVVRGKVVSIKEYGAFISLENSDRQGLLHRSAISNHPIENVSDVLEVGEFVYVKVISDNDGKLGLSMKVVNQTTGEDKDPNNLLIAQMEKRKQAGNRAPSPIRIGAVLNTVCKRCGVLGHLESSCFSQTGEAALGLLSTDSEEEGEATKSAAKELKKQLSREKKKKKKSEKKKKEKHSKHRHHRHRSPGSKKRDRSRSPVESKKSSEHRHRDD